MHHIRPTVKALRGLPRESFADPSMFDLARSSGDTKLIEELRLVGLEQPLLADALKQVSQGNLSSHQSCTAAARRAVFEARHHEGAGWRGAFVRDGDDWWLVFSDKHDKFNKRAAKVLTAARTDEWMPTDLDYDILDEENASRALSQWRTAVVRTLVEAITVAASQPGVAVTIPVPGRSDLPDQPHAEPSVASLTALVTHDDELDVEPVVAHTTSSILEVDLAITDLSDREQTDQLRNELIVLCVPCLGIPQEDLGALYKGDGALSVTVEVSHAKLLQLSQDPDTVEFDSIQPMSPGRLHYASKTTITAGYVTGSTVIAICGFTFVPTRDEFTASELPVCRECEDSSPSESILTAWQTGL